MTEHMPTEEGSRERDIDEEARHVLGALRQSFALLEGRGLTENVARIDDGALVGSAAYYWRYGEYA